VKQDLCDLHARITAIKANCRQRSADEKICELSQKKWVGQHAAAGSHDTTLESALELSARYVHYTLGLIHRAHLHQSVHLCPHSHASCTTVLPNMARSSQSYAPRLLPACPHKHIMHLFGLHETCAEKQFLIFVALCLSLSWPTQQAEDITCMPTFAKTNSVHGELCAAL